MTVTFSRQLKKRCLEGAFTYFNDFQGCWIKSLALLHDFAVDRFVNLIPYKPIAHNVVLNFYGNRTTTTLLIDIFFH